jgi:hypothetical protein
VREVYGPLETSRLTGLDKGYARKAKDEAKLGETSGRGAEAEDMGTALL